MIRDYATYMAYFKAIADFHPDINQFIPGPLDRVVSKERNITNWPILRVSDPGIDGDSEATYYKGSWMVLQETKTDDWAVQDRTINRMYHVAMQIITKMQADVDNGLYEITSSKDLDVLDGMTHANDYGWRYDYELRVPIGLCLEENSALDREIILPYFSYSISDNILSFKLAHDNWTSIQFTNWETGAQISALVPLNPSYETSANIGSFPSVFLAKMELSTGQVATALIAKSVPVGFSVPYIIS